MYTYTSMRQRCMAKDPGNKSDHVARVDITLYPQHHHPVAGARGPARPSTPFSLLTRLSDVTKKNPPQKLRRDRASSKYTGVDEWLTSLARLCNSSKLHLLTRSGLPERESRRFRGLRSLGLGCSKASDGDFADGALCLQGVHVCIPRLVMPQRGQARNPSLVSTCLLPRLLSSRTEIRFNGITVPRSWITYRLFKSSPSSKPLLRPLRSHPQVARVQTKSTSLRRMYRTHRASRGAASFSF
ncbi:hypothetical protein GGS23DRAFT_462298 [Durotheca rogersii]|uniref:uncharacterized protein n=1 Tax=Durotheca rogersii TaxID=419775 RepID=UPI00221FCA82|nr:uncharacterized protein GGS23DRAFT_462298 [Durotheca rogersii]KAI5864762.1 hypothetical protein GGS23DRAFT_462298 [Durotheca rogersii]